MVSLFSALLCLTSLVTAARHRREWRRDDGGYEYDDSVVSTITVVPEEAAPTAACEGSVFNGKNVNLIYWDHKVHPWNYIEASCLHVHDVITSYSRKTNKNIVTATTPVVRPVAASTITIDLRDPNTAPISTAKTTVIKTDRVHTFPYTEEVYTIAFVTSIYGSKNITTDIKTLAKPTDKPQITITSAHPVLYYKDVEIEHKSVKDGSCVTSTQTTTLPQVFVGYYDGNATEAWAGSKTVSGPIPTGNMEYLNNILGQKSLQPGTYAGLPTVAIISYGAQAQSCAFPVFAYNTQAALSYLATASLTKTTTSSTSTSTSSSTSRPTPSPATGRPTYNTGRRGPSALAPGFLKSTDVLMAPGAPEVTPSPIFVPVPEPVKGPSSSSKPNIGDIVASIIGYPPKPAPAPVPYNPGTAPSPYVPTSVPVPAPAPPPAGGEPMLPNPGTAPSPYVPPANVPVPAPAPPPAGGEPLLPNPFLSSLLASSSGPIPIATPIAPGAPGVQPAPNQGEPIMNNPFISSLLGSIWSTASVATGGPGLAYPTGNPVPIPIPSETPPAPSYSVSPPTGSAGPIPPPINGTGVVTPSAPTESIIPGAASRSVVSSGITILAVMAALVWV